MGKVIQLFRKLARASTYKKAKVFRTLFSNSSTESPEIGAAPRFEVTPASPLASRPASPRSCQQRYVTPSSSVASLLLIDDRPLRVCNADIETASLVTVDTVEPKPLGSHPPEEIPSNEHPISESLELPEADEEGNSVSEEEFPMRTPGIDGFYPILEDFPRDHQVNIRLSGPYSRYPPFANHPRRFAHPEPSEHKEPRDTADDWILIKPKPLGERLTTRWRDRKPVSTAPPIPIFPVSYLLSPPKIKQKRRKAQTFIYRRRTPAQSALPAVLRVGILDDLRPESALASKLAAFVRPHLRNVKTRSMKVPTLEPPIESHTLIHNQAPCSPTLPTSQSELPLYSYTNRHYRRQKFLRLGSEEWLRARAEIRAMVGRLNDAVADIGGGFHIEF